MSLLASLPLLLVLHGISSDSSYIRSRVNGLQDDATAHCLWWAQGTLEYTQSAAGNTDTPAASQYITKAWTTWQDQLGQCGNLQIAQGPTSQSRIIGYADDGGTNENLVVFRPKDCANVVDKADGCHDAGTCGNAYDCWSDDYPSNIIALTTTTYNKSTGQLFDADIELNAGAFFFTANDGQTCANGIPQQDCVAYDVQNTVTHEVGHVLGLAHIQNPDSTMYPSAPWGETSKRVLDNGSLKFVCDTYPKGAASRDCVVNASDLGVAKDGCTATGGAAAGAAGIVLMGLKRLLRRKG